MNVNALTEHLGVSQYNVSKHLRVLRRANLVEVEAVAQHRLYALRAEPLRAMSQWLERYRTVWDERFAQLDAVLAAMSAEPEQRSKNKRTEKKKDKRRRK